MFLTILYWIFIVFVGIISILVLIGIMSGNRNQNVGPKFKGAGPKDVEEKIRAYTHIENSFSNY
jgi:hypothetical protein